MNVKARTLGSTLLNGVDARSTWLDGVSQPWRDLLAGVAQEAIDANILTPTGITSVSDEDINLYVDGKMREHDERVNFHGEAYDAIRQAVLLLPRDLSVTPPLDFYFPAGETIEFDQYVMAWRWARNGEPFDFDAPNPIDRAAAAISEFTGRPWMITRRVKGLTSSLLAEKVRWQEANAGEQTPDVTSLRADLGVAQAELAVAQQRLTESNARVDTLLDWQRKALADMEQFSETLIKEAEDRDWCAEYDGVISRMNARADVLGFKERQVEFDVSVDAEVTIQVEGFSFSGTVSVNLTVSCSGSEFDENEVEDEDVEERVLEALGRPRNLSIDVDSWEVESYERG